VDDGSSVSSRKSRVLLVCSFLIFIFGTGAVQIGLEIRDGGVPQCLDLFRREPGRAHLRAFEKELEDVSWIRNALRPEIQHLRFSLFGNPGKDALPGKDGWLFYRPGVQYLVEPWPPPAQVSLIGRPMDASDVEVGSLDALSVIVSFRDQLAARGIQLMVMPVPGKASIYPDRLSSRAGASMGEGKTATFRLMDSLRAEGVEVLDLFSVYQRYREEHDSDTKGEMLYLTRDTHWTPTGMGLAARAAALRLLELGWVEPGTTPYDLKPMDVERNGDIAAMTQLSELEHYYPTEFLTCFQVQSRIHEGAYVDSKDSEILILGDSFMRIYQSDAPGSAGFIAHLAAELKQPLSSVVNDGGATTLVRQVVGRQPSWLEGKHVVLWEFVERDIRFGERGWVEIKLR
jgi:hypothetical protein